MIFNIFKIRFARHMISTKLFFKYSMLHTWQLCEYILQYSGTIFINTFIVSEVFQKKNFHQANIHYILISIIQGQ